MTERDPTGERRQDRQPTLYLMVGLPGAGKTIRAKAIESEHSALRLTPDEWILALYGHHLDQSRRDTVRDPVEAVQWQVAQRALALGCNVILDWGFWSHTERAVYRKRAEELGASVRVVFLDATVDELWSRISRREESAAGTLQITRAGLEEWAAIFEPPTEGELS